MNALDIVILLAMIIIGGYDLFLWREDRPTLSEQYQKLFPTLVDLIIFLVIFVALCYLSFVAVPVRIGIAGICGHICLPNRERYGEK
jgi:hypothetical protein